MGGKFGVGGKFDSLVGGSGSDRSGIRDDQRDDEFAFVAQDHGVQDVWASLESVFDGLRGHEFARRRLDQIFLAIGDEEIVVLVQVADVAGAEPAVLAACITQGPLTRISPSSATRTCTTGIGLPELPIRLSG